MAWIRIHNRANYPVNVKLTNTGVIHYHENNVSKSTEFNVGAVGWDFSAVFSCDATKIDPSKDNVAPITRW